jgi:hypothetical protein
MEKLVILLVILAVTKLVDLLKTVGLGGGAGDPELPPRAPGVPGERPPVEVGQPGGMRGLLEELLGVPAGGIAGPAADQAPPGPAAPVKVRRKRDGVVGGEPQLRGVRDRSRSGGRSGGESGVGPGTSRATGSGVARHVETAITAHVRQHLSPTVSESVRRDITEHVESTFGRGAVSGEGAAVPGERVEGIRGILRSPRGIQQAILVSEILNRPRIFRR